MGINKEIGGKRVMSDLDKEELIATRKLHGLDDGLFEEEKDQKKMNRENDEIEIENERDKNLYMQGYEQALKDANVNKFFQEGYIYGIQVENKNFIRNLEEVIYELKEKRKKGNIVIGYWQIKNMIEEIIKQCKIN